MDSITASEYQNAHSASIGAWNPTLVHHNALSVLDISPGDVFLDLGCGEGELLQLVQEKGAKAVGIDFEEEAIKTAQNVCSNVTCGSIVSLPFPDHEFDKISALGVLGYLSQEDLNKCLKECHRVLRPGGHMVMRTLTKRNLLGTYLMKYFVPGYASSDHHYSTNTYIQNLENAGFTIKKTWRSMDEENRKRTGMKKVGAWLLKPILTAQWIIASPNE